VRRFLVLVCLAAALGACGSPAPAPTTEYDVVAEAMKAFDKSDWVLAARLLREAIVKQPDDVRLHYSLAVCATHLDLRDEAIREFQWVVAHAPANSPEAVAARNWLTAAGVMVASASSGGAGDRAAGAPVDPDRSSKSAVRGQVSWNEGEPPVKLTRLQLFLKGINGTPTKDVHLVLRTDEEGRFEFKNVPAGTYRLTNRIAGEPLWRLKVDVAADQTVSVDLTPQNTVRVRDDFPELK
jgi:hypothetical protein